jgi:hypothetical protein
MDSGSQVAAAPKCRAAAFSGFGRRASSNAQQGQARPVYPWVKNRIVPFASSAAITRRSPENS